MTDPFAQDAARREALEDELMLVRLRLFEARESRDGQAALAAIDMLYAFVERVPEARVLHVGDDPRTSTAFAMPNTCRQITARYGGFCILCADRFNKGDVVYFDTDARTIFCARCSVKELTGQR